MLNHNAQPASSSESPITQVLALSELKQQPASVNDAATPSLAATPGAHNPLHQVKAHLTVHVGSAVIPVGELMAAKPSQVLRLDRRIDQPVDIVLEGQVVARGQLVAVGEHFGVRITELPVPLNV